ncbi:hypothetical protein Rctr16k_14 [Virus Rctr16k]|nr:hypothetical protein Rctr16k_14 [Virus Rctr16k]
MQLADALRDLLEQAAEAGARKALESIREQAPGVFLPVKAAPIPYRAILDAERAGELVVYRRGKSSFVRRDELEAWIARAPRRSSTPRDEVAEVIALNAERRTRGGRST